jgi:hypothetical protein
MPVSSSANARHLRIVHCGQNDIRLPSRTSRIHPRLPLRLRDPLLDFVHNFA